MKAVREIDVSRVRGLALEGGGPKGHAYAPVVSRLDELGVTRRLEFVAGASAGAIMAMLVAAGLRGRDLMQVALETDWGRFAPPRRWWKVPNRLWRAWKHLGIHDTAEPLAWLESRLEQAGLSRHVTMAELEARTGRRLYVTATNEEHVQQPLILCSETDPDLPVARAVLASMAVPVLFRPVEVNGYRFLSDGGLTHNFPVDVLAEVCELEPDEILGIRVDTREEIAGSAPEPVGGLLDRVARLYAVTHVAANRAHVREDLWERTLRVEVPDIPLHMIAVPRRRILELFAAGKRAGDCLYVDQRSLNRPADRP